MPTFPGGTGERMYACTYRWSLRVGLAGLLPVRYESVHRLPAAADSIAAFRATHQFIKLSTARTGLLTYSFGDDYMARCRPSAVRSLNVSTRLTQESQNFTLS